MSFAIWLLSGVVSVFGVEAGVIEFVVDGNCLEFTIKKSVRRNWIFILTSIIDL
jgi:hypothetical protein